MHYGVIGAGVLGLTAGLRLLQRGHEVTVLEAGNDVGGLAGSFEVEPGIWLEKFYHHLFRSDRRITSLIHELGLGAGLRWHRPETALQSGPRIEAFDSAVAVLQFGGLAPTDRIRAGLGAALLKAIPHPGPLENVTARRWLTRVMGSQTYAVIWEPLLRGKFGDAAEDISMAWLWARVHDRTRDLGYLDGGFHQLYAGVSGRITALGGEIVTAFRAASIEPSGSGVAVASNFGNSRHFDRVISTLPPSVTSRLTRDLDRKVESGVDVPYALGAHCLVLSLDRPLTGRYWISMTDRGSPFLAVVEHTAMIEPAAYGGRHLVYFGNYVAHGDRLFQESADETIGRFAPAIRWLNGGFDPDWVRERWSFAAPFAQPIVTPGFRARIPPFETGIKNLFVASMFQVFPHDRGQNYSIDLAERLVRHLDKIHP